jgi:1,4-alpha-glucan branching enzyme
VSVRAEIASVSVCRDSHWAPMANSFEVDTWLHDSDWTERLDASGHHVDNPIIEVTTQLFGDIYKYRLVGSSSLSWPFALT